MSFRTVVITNRCKLDLKIGYLVIRNEFNTTKIFIDEISTLILESTAISITTALLCELTKNKINIIITNQIYNNLKEISDTYLFEKSQELYKNIISYIGDLIENSDYPLNYNFNVDIFHIFKSCNLFLDILSNDILEQIINYVLIYRDIFNVNIFIFVNLKCVLSENEILNLYKTLLYKKIHILLIESDFKYKIEEYEIIRIIDKDLCEIY